MVIEKIYPYKDEKENLVYEMVRFEPKKFRPRRPDGKGGYIWGLGNVRRVLYRLPEILKARKDELVFIVEGEKDVESLETLGFLATCNPLGVGGGWRKEYSEYLIDLSVVIIPDNDSPGRQHAGKAATALLGKVKSVKILELEGLLEKGDVSDWIAAGGKSEELLKLAQQAEEWTPTESPNPPPINSRGDGAIELISLGSLREPEKYVPRLLDGRLIEGQPTILYGDGAQGKSLLAQAIAIGIASGAGLAGHKLPQGPVLYLDWELSVEPQLRRAYDIARGMGLDKPPRDLLYFAPTKPLGSYVPQLKRLIQDYSIILIVIDSFGLALGDRLDAPEVIMSAFSSIKELKASILIVDHQAKLQDGQNYQHKTPFGSSYKGHLTRSLLHIERISKEQNTLRVLVRHKKNNFGNLCEDLALKIDFTDKKIVVSPANMRTDPVFQGHLTTEDKILVCLQDEGPLTTEQIVAITEIPLKTVSNRLPVLRKQGKVVEQGKKDRKILWEIPGAPKGV